jgi:hypothetical protein
VGLVGGLIGLLLGLEECGLLERFCWGGYSLFLLSCFGGWRVWRGVMLCIISLMEGSLELIIKILIR